MHPLFGALLVSYVKVRVTCGAFVAHRYTFIIIITKVNARLGERDQDHISPKTTAQQYQPIE